MRRRTIITHIDEGPRRRRDYRPRRKNTTTIHNRRDTTAAASPPMTHITTNNNNSIHRKYCVRHRCLHCTVCYDKSRMEPQWRAANRLLRRSVGRHHQSRAAPFNDDDGYESPRSSDSDDFNLCCCVQCRHAQQQLLVWSENPPTWQDILATEGCLEPIDYDEWYGGGGGNDEEAAAAWAMDTAEMEEYAASARVLRKSAAAGMEEYRDSESDGFMGDDAAETGEYEVSNSAISVTEMKEYAASAATGIGATASGDLTETKGYAKLVATEHAESDSETAWSMTVATEIEDDVDEYSPHTEI